MNCYENILVHLAMSHMRSLVLRPDMAVLPDLFSVPVLPQNGGMAVMGLGPRLCTHLNQSMLQERCDTQLAPWSIDHYRGSLTNIS